MYAFQSAEPARQRIDPVRRRIQRNADDADALQRIWNTHSADYKITAVMQKRIDAVDGFRVRNHYGYCRYSVFHFYILFSFFSAHKNSRAEKHG